MLDARCEVSIKCSDVGLGEVCLALVIDGVDRMCTFCVRLVRRKMYMYVLCDQRGTILMYNPILQFSSSASRRRLTRRGDIVIARTTDFVAR